MACFVRFILPLMLAGCATVERAETPERPPTQSARSEFDAAIDRIAADAVESGPLDALSIVALRGDDFMFARGYGAKEVTADTTYRIGSITKMITALGIARLVESGRLRFEDRLGSLFPSALPQPDVTIAQLLNHTSGLASHETAAVARWRQDGLPITDEFVWKHVRDEPRAGAPGAIWSYSSSNFHLLGLIVEKITAGDYGAYVEQEIAAPLGLESLRICSGRPRGPRQRPDYIATQGQLVADPNWKLPGIGAAGGLCASALDVARLVHAMSRGKLVTRETLAQMSAPTQLRGGVEAGYGLGLRLGHLEGRIKWGHTGGGAVGNRSVVAHYPAHDLTIVVLTNTEREDTNTSAMDIEEMVARTVHGLAPRRTQDLPVPDASQYTGTYQSPGRRTRIVLHASGLGFSPVGSQEAPVTMPYLGGHEFLPDPEFPGYRFEFQIVQGRAAALSTFDGGWFTGVRLREADDR